MKNKKMTARQIELARAGLVDPVLFAGRFLGVRLWERQAEILQSIKAHRKTAIKAYHGVGKTFTLAVANTLVVGALPGRHRSHYIIDFSPGEDSNLVRAAPTGC